MGRLNDQAKHRIVVLRQAGLSLRKIKKILEFDNIKVTPQAVYLFLKRNYREPEKSGGTEQNLNPKGQPWEEDQLQDNGGRINGLKCRGTTGCKRGESGSQQELNGEGGIKIVSVTSLSEGNKVSQAVSTTQRVSSQSQASPDRRDRSWCSASLVPTPRLPVAPQQLNGRARLPPPPPRNSALLVTKKIVDRAIHLQKKVKDASTQTSIPSPRPASGEQLEAVRGELHSLMQAMQTLMDRQSRWEQEQHRQRQCNHQELVLQIQQLEATLGARGLQNCVPCGSGRDSEPALPDFEHFKMELL
ncbi:uncharacterized protein LOC142463545 isoform X2 [Ascaphus truei]|uniref:uncharacterized protein LOC142463545 isoform X2 n=1 Tax=Ascaphus truei TaxID=8439 RepID=UPI003F5994E5